MFATNSRQSARPGVISSGLMFLDMARPCTCVLMQLHVVGVRPLAQRRLMVRLESAGAAAIPAAVLVALECRLPRQRPSAAVKSVVIPAHPAKAKRSAPALWTVERGLGETARDHGGRE